MRKSEQKVAQCVQDDSESVPGCFVKAPAEMARAGGCPAVRFSLASGLGGYRDPERNLAGNPLSDTPVFENVNTIYSLSDIFRKFFRATREAAHNAMDRFNTLKGRLRRFPEWGSIPFFRPALWMARMIRAVS